MKGKGCLIGAAVGLGLMTVLLALIGPTLLREGGRIFRPIVKLKGAQNDFEDWIEKHRFSAPAEVTVTSEQLDRFLKLRRRLGVVGEENPLPIEGIRRNERPKLAEIEGLIEGMGGAVAGRMDAYREAGMPPEEYRYLERIVYRLWLRPLRAQGLDPACVARAAGELSVLATSEKNGTVASRLKRLAQDLLERRVSAPAGFSAETHALLLSRATDIDALIDAGPSMPMRGSGP